MYVRVEITYNNLYKIFFIIQRTEIILINIQDANIYVKQTSNNVYS